MKNSKRRPLEVRLPSPGRDRPLWGRVGVVGVVGLVVGIAWPTLAGIHVGPRVPGAKKPSSTAAIATASAKAAPSASASQTAVIIAPPAPKASNKQVVVASDGHIVHCFQGRERVKAEHCGTLRIDRVLVPQLRGLASCPSALGLSGELDIGFDLDFKKSEIRVLRGKKSELPATTVNGIFVCIADYIHDISLEKVAHKYSRYRVFYTLRFFPPGTSPHREARDGSTADDADTAGQRGLATVSWPTALVRDEPKTGKVTARLVRGTKVKIVGRRKEWYRVKIRESQEGWIYRAALGL